MRSLLDGLLLGDGYLTNYSKTPLGRPRFGYNCKEKDFSIWVRAQLGKSVPFSPNLQSKPNGYSTGVTYQVDSLRSDFLIPFWDRWYPEKKKILPRDLQLTPLAASMWYIGDGGFDSCNGYLRQIAFAAHSFTLAERQRLVIQLKSLGFRSRTDGKGKIFLSKKSIPAFLEWIGPCPISCYQYKWSFQSYTASQTKY